MNVLHFKFLFLKEIQNAPGWVQKLWQRKRLKKLLKFAYEKIPIYQKMLKHHGFEKLVLTNKDFFKKENIENYIFHSGPLYWKQTSGSTNQPFKFVHGKFSVPELYWDFLSYRFLFGLGYSFEDMTKTKIARIRMDPAFSGTNRFFLPVAEFLSNIDESINKIKKYGGEIIETYPSILMELCDTLNKKNIKLSFRFAASYGEMIYNEQRKYIEKTLSCELYDRYGLEEFGTVGSECREHKGFHLNIESFILEITDDYGKRLPDGVTGKVIITDLNNYQMPFIRYDTGDLGQIIIEPCKCRLSATRFIIKGRIGSFLNIGPRKIHHFEVAEIFNSLDKEISRYQVIQTSPNSIEIKISARPLFDETTENYLKNKFKEVLGLDTLIIINKTNTFEHLKNGKQSFLIIQKSP